MSSRRLSEGPARFIQSRNREETFQMGEVFGQEARGGEVVALIGVLGAGKTQFVQGLAKGLGIDESTVNSPTFALVQSYEGRLPLTHVDLYRLENQDEVAELGLEDYFEEGGVTAVEWADKAVQLLPTGRLMVTIHDLEADHRKVEIQATDDSHHAWLDRVLKKGVPAF